MIEQAVLDKLIEAGPLVILALTLFFGLPIAAWAVRAQISLFRSQQDIQRAQQRIQKEQQALEARLQLKILDEVSGTRQDVRRGLMTLLKEVGGVRHMLITMDVRDDRLVARIDSMELRLRDIAHALKLDQANGAPTITQLRK